MTRFQLIFFFKEKTRRVKVPKKKILMGMYYSFELNNALILKKKSRQYSPLTPSIEFDFFCIRNYLLR